MKLVYKKRLSFALVFALLFSLMPASFAAADDTGDSGEYLEGTEELESENLEEELESENLEEELESENLEYEDGAENDTNIGEIEYPVQPKMLLTTSTVPGNEIEPGELSIKKSASPSGVDKIWDMELQLTGKDIVQKTDVVLVIDRSGSMGENQKLANAKIAAKNFVSTLIPESGEGNIRIAVVSYAGNASINQALTNNTSDLNAAIDNMNAGGGTHTQAGIRQARIILNGSNANNKVIVLLSDGEPTYSYDVQDGYKNHTQLYNHEVESHWYWSYDRNHWYYETLSTIPESLMDYGNSEGSGSNLRWRKDLWKENEENYHYYDINNGNQAIAESGFARGDGQTVYAVGLSLGTTGQEIMDGIGGGTSYSADPSSLNTIFQQIANNVAFAASNAVVTDPIGDEFDLYIPSGQTAEESIQILDKNDNPIPGATVSWNAGAETFTANIGNVTEALSPIKIKYQVKIDDDATPGVLYPTNGRTYVTYTDSDGNSNQEKDFTPIPQVGIDAASITVYNLFIEIDDNGKGKLLKTEVANFGNPAINKNDAILETYYHLDPDTGSSALDLNKEYTVNAKTEFSLNIGGEAKTFVLQPAVGEAYGTGAGSNISTNGNQFIHTFTSYGNVEVYFVYTQLTHSVLTYAANNGITPDVFYTETRPIGVSPLTALSYIQSVESDFTAPLGYVFDKWTENQDGTGASYADEANFDLSSCGAMLYAQWKKDCTAWLDVTYDGNGNTAGNPPADEIDAYLSGDTVTVNSNSGLGEGC